MGHRTPYFEHHYVGKVLVPMTPKFDTQGRQQIPLLIYWAVVGPNVQTAMQPQGSGGHLFTIANPSYEPEIIRSRNFGCSRCPAISEALSKTSSS